MTDQTSAQIEAHAALLGRVPLFAKLDRVALSRLRDFLVKPCPSEELIATVERALA